MPLKIYNISENNEFALHDTKHARCMLFVKVKYELGN